MKTKIIFGDIEFIDDIAYINKIYGILRVDSLERAEQIGDQLTQKSVYDAYVIPEIYGEENIVYKCTNPEAETVLVQVYDNIDEEIGLYNVPKTIKDVKGLFESTAKNLTEDDSLDDLNTMLEDKFGIVRVYVDESVRIKVQSYLL